MLIIHPEKHYDIVVVGGGMVGASFACALIDAVEHDKFSVLVVEATVFDKDLARQSSFDARSTALSYGSKQIFHTMGLWQQLEDAATAINEVHVSDKGRLGSVQLNREEQKVEALGYVVENQHLGNALSTAMEQSAHIDLLRPASVSSIQAIQNGMNLHLHYDNQQIELDACLVILADAGKSPVCKQLGIERSIERYDQYALISTIVFEKPHNNVAFERFTDTGPLAVLPLQSIDGKNRSSLVWTVTASQASEFKELSKAALLEKLQERFGYRLGKIQDIGERFSYPLSLSLAKEQVRPGIVLLGNVAHTLHPVAGQGLNLALRDAEVLVDVLCQARKQLRSPGEMTVLLDYLKRQEGDQAQTASFTHKITQLFSSSNEANAWLRKFGLLVIDIFPKVRRSFTERAMGLSKHV